MLNYALISYLPWLRVRHANSFCTVKPIFKPCKRAKFHPGCAWPSTAGNLILCPLTKNMFTRGDDSLSIHNWDRNCRQVKLPEDFTSRRSWTITLILWQLRSMVQDQTLRAQVSTLKEAGKGSLCSVGWPHTSQSPNSPRGMSRLPIALGATFRWSLCNTPSKTNH